MATNSDLSAVSEKAESPGQDGVIQDSGSTSSRCVSSHSSNSTAFFRGFKSRLVTDPVPKPWLEDKKKRTRRYYCVAPIIGLVVGIVICGFLLYDGYSTINKHK